MAAKAANGSGSAREALEYLDKVESIPSKGRNEKITMRDVIKAVVGNGIGNLEERVKALPLVRKEMLAAVVALGVSKQHQEAGITRKDAICTYLFLVKEFFGEDSDYCTQEEGNNSLEHLMDENLIGIQRRGGEGNDSVHDIVRLVDFGEEMKCCLGETYEKKIWATVEWLKKCQL